MSFVYSNNFLFKNDVAASIIITKKKKKRNFGDVFPISDKYGAVH